MAESEAQRETTNQANMTVTKKGMTQMGSKELSKGKGKHSDSLLFLLQLSTLKKQSAMPGNANQKRTLGKQNADTQTQQKAAKRQTETFPLSLSILVSG